MIDKPEQKSQKELVEIVKIQQEEYSKLLDENSKLKDELAEWKEALSAMRKRALKAESK